MPQKTVAHSKGILEDLGLNTDMPFNFIFFFPHFIVFLIGLFFLLSTFLESFQPSDEQHLIKNKQLENKGMVWLIKKYSLPSGIALQCTAI